MISFKKLFCFMFIITCFGDIIVDLILCFSAFISKFIIKFISKFLRKHNNKNDNSIDEYVKTNIGTMPVEDYLDIHASQCGYDDYKSMVEEGYIIDGYDEITQRYKSNNGGI